MFMRLEADSHARRSKHNIPHVAYYKTVNYPAFLNRLSPEFLTQTGIARAVCSSRSLAASHFFSGAGAACSISIPAAKSSARASIIASINCISCFRKFPIRLSRVSLNSRILPWCTDFRYSMIRRSRSSAVPSGRIGYTPQDGISDASIACLVTHESYVNNHKYSEFSTPHPWREVMGIAQPIISFRADIDTLFCLEQLHDWFPFLSQSQRCNVTFRWAWKYAAEHKIDLQSDIAQRVLLISLSKRFTNSTKPIPPKSITKTRKVAASA